jgi:hypothetical protein
MEIDEANRRYNSNVERSQLFLCALISRALQESLLLRGFVIWNCLIASSIAAFSSGASRKAEESTALTDERALPSELLRRLTWPCGHPHPSRCSALTHEHERCPERAMRLLILASVDQ